MTVHEPLGTTNLDDQGRWSVRFERHLRHDRDTVWRALTESRHLAAWLPCDIVGERRAGAPIELRFWPDHVARYGIEEPSVPGRIQIWDPPAVFEWTWGADVLRWELAPLDDGTLLTFTTRLADDAPGVARTAAGYHVCLGNLRELLDTGEAGGLVDIDAAPWERRYEEQLAAAS